MNAIDTFKSWMNAVEERNLENIMILFNICATIHPTFSSKHCSTSEEIRAYFKKLCTYDAVAISFDERNLIHLSLSKGLTLLSGTYEFQVTDKSNTICHPSRFTCLIDLNKEKPILHLHSSVIPS